jgi:hypothetical protein
MSPELYRKIKALLLVATLVGAEVHQVDQNVGLFSANGDGPASAMGNLNLMEKLMGKNALMGNVNLQEQASSFAQMMGGMQEHAAAFTQKVEAMMDDLRMEKYSKQIAQQVEALAKNPHFHLQASHLGEQMESMLKAGPASQEHLVNRIQQQMEAMMQDPMVQEQGQSIAEQMRKLTADPELQEQAKALSEHIEAVKPSPETQAQVTRVMETMSAMANVPQKKWARAMEKIEAMIADPSLQEQAKLIDESMQKFAASGDAEQAKRVEEQIQSLMASPDLQKQVKRGLEQMKGMIEDKTEGLKIEILDKKDSASQAHQNVFKQLGSSNSNFQGFQGADDFQGKMQGVAEQVEAMMAHPGSPAQAKRAAEHLETIMADPKFQEHATRFAEQMEAMKLNPKFKDHAKRLNAQVEAMLANPHFQEQVSQVAERMESGTEGSSPQARQQAQVVAEKLETAVADLALEEKYDSMDLADRMVDRVVDNLFDRAQPLEHQAAALDGTTAAKPLGLPNVGKMINMEGGKKEVAPAGGSNSIVMSSANTVKAILGAGILSLSWAFYYSTMVPAMFFSLLMALLGAMNFFLLGLVSDKTKQPSYTEIWAKLFGKSAGILPDLVIAISCFANCAGYLIVAGDYMPIALKGLGLNILQGRRQAIGAVFALIFGLNFLPDLSLLSYTSVIGVLGGIYTCAMLGVDGFKAGLKASDWKMFSVTPGWFLMIPAVAFAFNGHFNAPSAYTELSERSPKRWATVTTIAFSICFIATIACGASGYLMFGSGLALPGRSNVLTAPYSHTTTSRWSRTSRPLSPSPLGIP